MLSMIWWLPLALGAAAVVPLWRGAQRLGQEAAALRSSIDALARLRPLVADLRAEVAAVGSAVNGAAAAPPRSIHHLGPR
jgi:hypothetical protein